MNTHDTPLDRAIAIVGGQSALAAALNIKPPSVSEWVRRDRETGRGVPAERCLAIERLTSGAVTRYELRLDVFGPRPSTDLPDHEAA